MDIHWCAFNQCLVTFLRVFLRRISEKSGANSSTNTIIISTSGDNIMLIAVEKKLEVHHTATLENIPIHDTKKLFPDILRSPHTSRLYEILITPRVGKVASLPAVPHSK